MRLIQQGFMRTSRTVPVAVFLLFAWGSAVFSTDAQREVSAITVQPSGVTKFQLRSTDRLPDAAGEARVERRGGMTEIEVHLDSLKPASLFGGDYNTYVLWIIPPRGPAENAGELQLDGNRSGLRASTKADTFALLITAEPHYLVSIPSPFVILKNISRPGAHLVPYQPIEGVYNFQRSSLADVKKARGEVHTDVRQAFTAVRLAQRAQAARYAPEALQEAQHALDQTFDLWRRRVNHSEIAARARATIRLALTAQHLAEARAFHVRLEVEGVGEGRTNPEGTFREKNGL
jgi:hypothetical protein